MNHWLQKQNKLKINDAIEVWDFQTELNKTIKEKYESKHFKIIEIKNVTFCQTIHPMKIIAEGYCPPPKHT